MAIILNGLSLQYFRGIGPEPQRMGPFKKFNFFIGPNNAGKSTVIDFLYSFIPFPDKSIGPRDGHADKYQGAQTGAIQYELAFRPEQILKNASFPHRNAISGEQQSKLLELMINSLSKDGLLWVKPEGSAGIKLLLPTNDFDSIIANSNQRLWAEWSSAVSGASSNPRDNFLRVWQHFTRNEFKLPSKKPILIPAKRVIGHKEESFDDFSGKGLINQLAEIQNPSHSEQDKKNLFAKINQFVKSATEKSDALIEIPFDREHILVHMDNKVLPLSSLGTGIHEVILIAAACTLNDETIVCIEEPETHLHPLLQRRLIDYLRDETDNQYFIATHSATFIDAPDSAVFQVSNNGVQTKVTPAILKPNKREICNELGYKASDILQTNAIVWVEGPSDRIYLKHWLKSIEPDLEEGLHFSVMFYGGRLLKHLSANDEQVDGFIDLLSLNKNSAILIDSDRDKRGARINATKKRIEHEFELAKAFCWVTAGREIENYVDQSLLQEKVKETHPKVYKKPIASGRYDHALNFQRTKPKPGKTGPTKFIETEVDKVSVAQRVVEKDANLDVLDLKLKITALAKFLRAKND